MTAFFTTACYILLGAAIGAGGMFLALLHNSVPVDTEE